MSNKKIEARAFLEQVEKADAIIANKLIEKQQWHDLALSITSGSESVLIERNGKKELHNMEKVQSSGSPSKMADAVAKCIDMEDEIDIAVARLVAVKKDVTQTIEQLYSPTEYNVLHMRYIQYKSLQEIEDHYGKSEGWAKVTCKRATSHVQAILNKK